MNKKTIWILIGAGALIIMTTGKTLLDSVVNNIALAIQNAEGQPGDLNYRINNPGMITDMGRPGQTGTYLNPASGITFPVFDTYQNGFAALVWKIKRALTGESSVYSPDMTFYQFFNVYSGDPNEAENVASYLGVDPNSTLSSLLG